MKNKFYEWFQTKQDGIIVQQKKMSAFIKGDNADLESLITRIDVCKNNLQKLSIAKVGEQTPCGYSLSTIRTFDGMENRHDVYRVRFASKSFVNP